jgi:hypothetical protein
MAARVGWGLDGPPGLNPRGRTAVQTCFLSRHMQIKQVNEPIEAYAVVDVGGETDG